MHSWNERDLYSYNDDDDDDDDDDDEDEDEDEDDDDDDRDNGVISPTHDHSQVSKNDNNSDEVVVVREATCHFLGSGIDMSVNDNDDGLSDMPARMTWTRGLLINEICCVDFSVGSDGGKDEVCVN